MPRYKSPEIKGDLVIKFEVDFPDYLDEKSIKSIESVLKKKSPAIPSGMPVEEVTLANYDQFRSSSKNKSNLHDDDDMDYDDHEHGPNVQCAQQ